MEGRRLEASARQRIDQIDGSDFRPGMQDRHPARRQVGTGTGDTGNVVERRLDLTHASTAMHILHNERGGRGRLRARGSFHVGRSIEG
jgi:hypothetical protein